MMKARLCILAVCCVVLLSSCEKNVIGGADANLGAFIAVRNSDGQNLLVPSTRGYLDPKNIKIFYLYNGERKEIFGPNPEVPRPFEVLKYPKNGEYYMTIGLSGASPSVTYLQWNDTDEDTLTCTLINGRNSINIYEVFWNGKLKFRNNDPSQPKNWGTDAFGRFFEVVK